MLKFFKFFLIGLFVYLFLGLLFHFPVFALECDDGTLSRLGSYNFIELNGLNDKCNQAFANMERAIQPSREELARAEKAIAAFQNQIKLIEADVARKTAQIDEGEKQLVDDLIIASGKIREFYMRSYAFNPLALFFSSGDIGTVFRNIGYQQAVVNEDKKTITQIAITVKDLENKKTALESERVTLAKLKADTDARAASLRTLVGQAMAYESKVQGWISQISAAQQRFLQQKLAGLGISRSAYSLGKCVDDRPIDPGFSPRFAMFTFGVPNRIGLNQYGAKGRAEAGQDPKTILAAYYNADYTEGYNQSINIHVTGNNEYGQSFDDNWNIEEYLKHLYEMPTNWDIKALKAQAIAARSYVLAYTNNGQNNICPSQQCQVVKKELNSDAWQQAVRETAGIVLTNGGQPIKAWFSSTHGGYIFSSSDIGWSETGWTKRAIDTLGSINSFSDLFASAYDRSSPWFYCDWGSRGEKKTAWLRPEEVADIVNVMLLANADPSTQKHLVQTDKPNPDNVDTWDSERVKDELRSRQITPLNSVNDVSIDWDKSNGVTTRVNISGDGGNPSFDGDEFKNYFNLRAPTNIQIVGPLFNVERK